MSDRESFALIEKLFLAALSQSASSREEWLEAQPVDPELRSVVRGMLDQDQRGPTFRLWGVIERATGLPSVPDSLGEFELRGRIGEGGMGIVFAAYQPSLGRTVALKVIRPELMSCSGARERFRREAHAAAALTHDNIVPVHAFGEEGGFAYLAMPWIEGSSLAEVLRMLQARPPAQLGGGALAEFLGAAPDGVLPDLFQSDWTGVCVRIATSIADALGHAHREGVVHRDVKPSNIMLTRQGRVLLLDFGIAHDRSEQVELTGTGAQPGSPAYMAPEQIRGDRSVSPAVDVFALGVTLYELLALRPPFRGATLPELTQRILHEDPERLQGVPLDLRVITAKALEKETHRRYRDGSELADELRRFASGRPILARPVGPLGRLYRWSGRYPTRAALAVLGVLLATALGVLAYQWPTLRAEAARSAELRLQRSLETGYMALDAGDPEAATEAFRTSLALAPDSSDAVAGLVLAHCDAGRPAIAETLLGDTVLRSAPQLGWAHVLVLRRLGRQDAADQAMRDSPRTGVLSRYLRARLLRDPVRAGELAARQQVVELLDTTRLLTPPKARHLFELAHALGHYQPFQRIEERRSLAQLILDGWGATSARARYWAAFVRSPRDPRKSEACARAWPDGASMLLEAQLAESNPNPSAAAKTVERAERENRKDAPWLRVRLQQETNTTATELLTRLPPADSDVQRVLAARIASAAGQYRRALEWIGPQPSSVPLQIEWGVAKWRLGEVDAAASSLEGVTRTDPTSVAAWFWLAKVRSARGDRTGSMAALQRAIDLDNHLDSRLELGRIHLRARELELAERQLEAVVERRPTDSLARTLYGEALFLRGASTAAVQQLSEALALDETNTQARIELARARVARREFATASRLIRDVRAESLDRETALRLVWTLRRIPEPSGPRSPDQPTHLQRAEQICRSWIARDNSAGAHRLLAWVLFDTGRYDHAIPQLRQAVQSDPGKPLYWVDMAQMHRLVAARQALGPERRKAALREAEVAIGHALAHGEPSQEALLQLAELRAAQGDARAAERVLRTGVGADARRFRIAGRLGRMLASQGRHAEAIDFYLRALRARPEYPDAQFGLAKSSWAVDRCTEAAAALDSLDRMVAALPVWLDDLPGLIRAEFDGGRFGVAAGLFRILERRRPAEFSRYLSPATLTIVRLVGGPHGRKPADANCRLAWYRQGLGWLNAWLRRILVDGITTAERRTLQAWLRDPDFAALREVPEGAGKRERELAEQVWRDVRAAATR